MPSGVQILPVVEIMMFSFSERESPKADCSRVEWEEYERLCARDAGLESLTPVAPGSWFYAVSQLVEPHVLKTLAQHELDRFGDDEEPLPFDDLAEYWSAMDGGLAVMVRGDLLTAPGCCCDLTEVDEWRAAIDERTTTWVEPWTGHDAEAVRIRHSANADTIEFQVTDFGKQDWSRSFSLTPEEAAAQLNSARQQQEQLAERLAAHLPAEVPEAARKPLARLFAGVSLGK